jgi:ATP-dependent helicase HrpB
VRLTPLPIDAHVDTIRESMRRSRAVVVTAAPGAGKTTRLPPALAADGPVILLQPRRVAARAIAARIASERAWTLGRDVGWQIRFERRFTADTRLLVVTEGILTARLQADPLLSDFLTIVIDEFHERSIHADVAFALARQAWRARDDLRIVVMSATLDTAPVSAFLDGCPVVDVPGRMFPLEIAYEPGRSVVESACDVLQTSGSVLCFLPGAPEIQRVVADLQSKVPADVEILPLHGSLDVDAQSRAIEPASARRVIVATNIAETSLTVPGVTAVVDTGLHKVARYDAERGVDSLETERVPQDAADQRAGRAGRIAAGIVRRLWDARDRLRRHREPEIHRVDLSSAALDIIAWGGDPRTFEWFERPREEALEAAVELLGRLGLVSRWRPSSGGPARDQAMVRLTRDATYAKLTDVGERVRRIPLHPRLARMLVAGDGSGDIARACALLSERRFLPARTATTTSDLLSAIDRWETMPPHVRRAADEILKSFNQSEICNPASVRSSSTRATARLAEAPTARRRPQSEMSELQFRRAVFAGYPDRVAKRREPGSPNVLLASGSGAVISPESGVRDGEFLIALDLSQRSGHTVPRVRIASIVDGDWLMPTSTNVEHRFDAASGTVRARRVERYEAIVLAEHPVPVDTDVAAQLIADAWIARGPTADDQRVLRRLRFAGRDVDLAGTIRLAAHGVRRLDEIALDRVLPAQVLRDLDRDAPDTLAVPSGRRVALDYAEDGSVSASVKLQELFGLADTPRIGPRRVAVSLSLLAPNGRPVQITRDLRSFWDRTYPDVRKELRGRYPKHPWPDDPWTATPTARTTRRHR